MLAAIDVGSNTVRMLLGDVLNGTLHPIRYERKITRLKGGQTGSGLDSEAMSRTYASLKRFVESAAASRPVRLCAVGTEALRSASNGADFVSMVSEDLALDFRIISGDEEAALSAAGVLAALDPLPGKALIIDIGGGSTEFILVVDGNVTFRKSVPLGVVHLAEMSGLNQRHFLVEQLLSVKKSLEMSDLMRDALADDCRLVGTAGTITTLAAIDLEMDPYDWQLVNNHCLPAAVLEKLHRRIEPLSVADRESIIGLEEGRGDLIIPGLDVLLEVMALFEKSDIVVSDFGLLEGLLLQMAEQAAID